MRRKLLCITAAVISGIVYMHFFETVWIPVSAFAASVLFSAGRGKDRAFAKVLAILLSCFLAGAFLLYRENSSAQQTVFEDGRQAEFYCLVTEITKKESDKGDSYQLCVKTGGE